MQGNDVVTIIITFIIGFVGGFYFFLTGYAPYVEEIKESIFTQDQDTVESLIVVGKQYGGCDRANLCASFQLEYNGSYRYLPESVLLGTVPVEGVLPRAVLSEVRAVTAPSKLRSASAVSTAEDCASYVDSVDYSYEIVRNGELFVLDTCTTKLNQYPDILDALDNVWSYVSN